MWKRVAIFAAEETFLRNNMERKKYLCPRCEAYCLAGESIICLSAGLGGNYNGFGGEYDMGGGYGGGGGFNGFGDETEM